MNKTDYNGICLGIVIGLIISYVTVLFIFGLTLDARDIERHHAIKAKVAEYYINNRGKLEFRYLTEHKNNQLIKNFDE